SQRRVKSYPSHLVLSPYGCEALSGFPTGVSCMRWILVSPRIIIPASAIATRTKITAARETLTTVVEIPANPTIMKRSIPQTSRFRDELTEFRDILLREEYPSS